MCFLNPPQQGQARGGRPRAIRAGSTRCRVTEGLTGLVRLLGPNPAAGPGAQIALKIDLDVTRNTYTRASSVWHFGVHGDSPNALQMQPRGPRWDHHGHQLQVPRELVDLGQALQILVLSLKEPSLISKRSVTSLPSHLLQLPR